MDLEKQLEEIEALGNDHIGTSSNTPLRDDAFELSDIEKIAAIKKDVTNILHTLGMDLKDDSLKGTPSRVAKMFVQCLIAEYTGSKSYNVRGDVVDLQTFHTTLCEAEPSAKELVTFGENQLPIAFDLDDGALQRDVGPIVKTPLVEGVRRTLEHFRRLRDEERLDDGDLA